MLRLAAAGAAAAGAGLMAMLLMAPAGIEADTSCGDPAGPGIIPVSQAAPLPGDLTGPVPPAGKQINLDMTPERTANATAIVSVALSSFRDDPITPMNEQLRAAVIGVGVSMQESGLVVIDFGDLAGPDSRGLFQQRTPWGPYDARMDPVQSATFFFTGGAGGQTGLNGIPGWQQMSLEDVGVAVQISVGGYAKWENAAIAVVDSLRGTTPAAGPPGGGTTGGTGPAACAPTGGVAPAGSLTADGAVIPPGLVTKTTGWDTQPQNVLDPTGTGGHVTARTAALVAALTDGGLAPGGISCWDAHLWNPTSFHPRGLACDVFFAYPAQVAQGWGTANWLVANQAALGVRELIWQGLYWSATDPGAWVTYQSSVYGCPNPAEVTGCHYDHIHVSEY
jgi:hypothetical protein